MSSKQVDVVEAIDSAPIGRFQIRVFILCGLIALFDGFDVQSIAFVASLIARDWGLDRTSLGPIFSAGLAGLMVGQLVLSILSDRFGRRRVIILSTFLFGVMTLAIAFAQNWWMLFILRFLAGIGLGGAIPNIMAMTSEFAPRRVRAMMVAIVFGGFPMGAIVGGYVSIHLIAAFGWQSVFVVGGIAPLILVPILLWALPESPRFLLRENPDSPELRRVVARIVPEKVQHDTMLINSEVSTAHNSITALFHGSLVVRTLLLWGTFFMSLMVIYFLMSWLPMVMNERGYSVDLGIGAAMVLNLGGAIGGVVIGRLIDRFNPIVVLSLCYLSGAAAIVAIGAQHSMLLVLFAAIFWAGFCSIGSQTGLSAYTVGIYPTALRSTGIGSALTVGRLGAIVGPMAGGMLLASGRPMSEVFLAVAVPSLFATFAIVVLGVYVRRQLARQPVVP